MVFGHLPQWRVRYLDCRQNNVDSKGDRLPIVTSDRPLPPVADRDLSGSCFIRRLQFFACVAHWEAGHLPRGRIQMTSKELLRYSFPLIVSSSLLCVIEAASAKIIFKADFETGDLSE